MLDETGCDAVMIGRGCIGNPWLIKEVYEYLEHGSIISKPTNKDILTMIKRHYNMLEEDKNPVTANLEMRTFLMYYLKGIPGTKELKNKLCSVKNKEEIFELLDTKLGE